MRKFDTLNGITAVKGLLSRSNVQVLTFFVFYDEAELFVQPVSVK